MFGKFHEMMNQMQALQRMMKDENFKTLMSHPKIQELLKDPDFQGAVRSQDMAKIATHPKLQELLQDPELSAKMKKMDPRMFGASASS